MVLSGDIKFKLSYRIVRNGSKTCIYPHENALVLRMRDLAQTLRQKTVVISCFTVHIVLGIRAVAISVVEVVVLVITAAKIERIPKMYRLFEKL
jgi:hypothetical protein